MPPPPRPMRPLHLNALLQMLFEVDVFLGLLLEVLPDGGRPVSFGRFGSWQGKWPGDSA